MSDNGISWNYGPLNTSNNGLIEGGERENSVIQTEQNFTVDKKSQQTSLTTAFNNLDRIVREKLKPCFKNSWKNFWHRGRKKALAQTQAALDTLKDKDGKFTLGKLKYNTGLFNEALNNKGLSKVSREALETLVKELKAETGIYFKTTYSEKQLEKMFASVKQHEENLLGEGSYGKVYTNDDGRLAFKIINSEKAFEADVHGNKAFGKGAENFTKNKEFFYRQSDGFVTDYIGAFEQDGQRVVVFERIKGKDFSKYIEEKRKIEQQQPLNTASAEKQLRKDCIILSQMATAVAAVHESGCINRDIKPQNTIISVQTTTEPERNEAGNVIRNDNKEIQMKQTEVPYVKLIDQGTVIDLKEGKPLSDIPIGGTLNYMPKEFVDEKPISPASDIYALGISIMETVCTDIDPFKNMPGANDNETLFGKNLPNAIKQCFGDKMPFLRDLVLKCCSSNPEDRPSAAQVAYCLEFYTSVIGTDAEKDLKFDEVLKMAEADRQKGIPLALREMMQSEDEAVQQKGIQAVLNLCDADPSYKKTPSYGLALLRMDKQKFETWASDCKNAFQALKDRIYAGAKPKTEGGVWSEKDIKVSQDEFNAINNLFPNENVNPKNIA